MAEELLLIAGTRYVFSTPRQAQCASV